MEKNMIQKQLMEVHKVQMYFFTTFAETPGGTL